MRKGFAALILVGLVFVLTRCGGGSSMPFSNGGSGSVAVFGSDAPLCSVLSFTVTITSATLTPSDGGTPVSVISSTSPATVDFASLMEFMTVLNFASVPKGSYTQLNLTLSNPQLVVMDPTTNTPTPVPVTLTSATASAPINPELDVMPNANVGIKLDFNMLKSIQTDSNGQVTGTVTPVFRVVTIPSSTQPDIDHLEGLIDSVNTTSNDPNFVGSFVLKTEDGRAFKIWVTSTTKFFGLTGSLGLTGLTPGTFVELLARVDSNNNLVARVVGIEEDENETLKGAFVGPITQVSLDSSGNVTSFTMFVRHEYPLLEVSECVLPRTTLAVNLASTTIFGVAARAGNPDSLTLDPSKLAVGENVAVHGVCQAGTPPSTTAIAVVLRPRPVLGNFQQTLAVGSDNLTGGFQLVPCGPLFGSQPINVLTFSNTQFNGVSGLSGLTAQPLLVVRGLLFWEPTQSTFGSVTVTPPSRVLEASHVHQLSFP